MDIAQEIRGIVRGEVTSREEDLQHYSRDASLFRVTPSLVVFPRDAADIKALVHFVAAHKRRMPSLSLTARAAGTDMTGGPLSDSIVVDTTKYLHHLKELNAEKKYVVVEPGLPYREMERETLKHHLIFPSYPASKNLCALGGIVNNNSGGERSLVYGKTEDYVESVNMVLADGNEYQFAKLSRRELEKKMRQQNFEGKVYREMFQLVEEHYEEVKRARPNVSKNSTGYNIWSVWDGEHFDLSKIFVGAQGTLGIMTEARLRLVPTRPYRGMLVVFLNDFRNVGEVVTAVLPHKPAAFESFDDHTLRLALKFLPEFMQLLKPKNLFALALQFLPEFLIILRHLKMPKLVLLIEFEGKSHHEVMERIEDTKKSLEKFPATVRVAANRKESEKYWAIRRESFNLLRRKVRGKHAAPFVDDIIVRPEFLPEFLPRLYAILDRYQLLYTIAGHVGNGNFHIIPLMDLRQKSEREKIPRVSKEVYKLVLHYGGSLSAEHNDGLIRGPYLQQMYGRKVFDMFVRVKKIFDPQGIFNPRKKTGASLRYAMAHIRKDEP